MQKQAPSIGRILVAVGFTLSCFGLLLFLWVTFGGPIPFKPESYRSPPTSRRRSRSPRSPTCGSAASRSARSRTSASRPRASANEPTVCNTTEATIEIDPQYAPISSDARAILRQKTLLGETYIELTTGSQAQPGQSSQTTSASLGSDRRRPALRRRRAPADPRGGTSRSDAGPGRDPDRRDLPGLRQADAGGVPGLDAELAPSRSTAAASTSTTPSATSARSPPTPATCSAPSGARSSLCARWSTTPATSSPRSLPTTRRWPGRSSGPTGPSARSPRRAGRCPTPSRSSRPSRTRAGSPSTG